MDAAITQPSTVALEAMLTGLPTAIIDYPITPQYIYAAWHISDWAHIQPTINELLNPSAEQLAYQTALLRLQLECQSPALPRLHQLIEKMVDIGRQARATNAPLVFPHHLLSPAPMPPVESALDGATALQIELLNLRQKHDTLKRQANMKQLGYWTRRAWGFVSRRV